MFWVRLVAEVPDVCVTSEENLMAHLCANSWAKRCSIESKYQFGLPEVQHKLAGWDKERMITYLDGNILIDLGKLA